MKNKIILFSSIFALILSFCFLVPLNNVSAAEGDYQTTISKLFLNRTISLRNFDDPETLLFPETETVITNTMISNNQLFFKEFIEYEEQFFEDDFYEGSGFFYIRIDLDGLDTLLFEITSTFNNSFVAHEFIFHFTDNTEKIFVRNDNEDYLTFAFTQQKKIDYLLFDCSVEYFPSSFILTNYYDQYLSGYNKGYDEGYTEGILQGRNDGYDLGYDAGFNAGIADKNPIRLDYLFWTIAGVPFETFKTIWNFDFLGINLANFFTGLIMSLVAIWFVKRFLF